MSHQVSVEIGGRTLTFETGKIARQAHGAVVATYGDTVLLATACMDTRATEKDFLPLTVDYRENTYSAGRSSSADSSSAKDALPSARF